MSNDTSAFVGKARQFVKNKDSEAAVTTLRAGLKHDPDNRTAQEMLGVLLFRLKRQDEATDAFRQLTRLDPRDASAWVNLGAALNVQHDHKGASVALRKAIQRDKRCAVAYYNLAIAQNGQNEPKMAISAYEECLKLEPANTEASINLANMLLKEKNYGKASKAVNAALEHAPKSVKLRRLLSQAEAGIENGKVKESPFGRLVDEEDLARSQKTLIRRELGRTDRNRERELMRETARELRHAVRPMVPILDFLPRQMHTLHIAGARQDTRNDAFTALEGLTATISELARIKQAISRSVMEMRSHLKKTDPGL